MAEDLRKKQPDQKRIPRRYKLYDRLHVSVSVINGIIYALIGLILLLVFAGMVIR